MYKKLALAGSIGLMLVSNTSYSKEYDNQIAVDLKDNISDEAKQAFFDRFMKKYNQSKFYASDLEEDTKINVMLLPNRMNKADVIADLADEREIENVEPVYEYSVSWMPNDLDYSEQWSFRTLKMESAWDYTRGSGVTVAVLDTGVACEDYEGFHKLSDLQQTKCVSGWNFVTGDNHAYDDHGHGSHVAGTIAQSTNNGLGLAGIAHRARIMPVKVLSGSGSGTTLDIADGIRWASDNGAHVINMSLGGGGYSQILADAIVHARSKGTVIIAAAGNNAGAVNYPAAYDGVIAVSATDSKNALAEFSCFGPEIDIGAPGVGIKQQTICDGGLNNCEQFVAWNGTSMATPHVAGVAAMIMSMGITDVDKVEELLKQSATGANNPASFGAGILNANSAVKKTTYELGMSRLFYFGVLTMLLGLMTSKIRKDSLVNKRYILAGILSGVGLFALPTLTGAFGWSWILSRPLADMDLILLGAGVHKFLPLATFILPLLFTSLTWHMPKLRMVSAGLSMGLAAYLMSTLMNNFVTMPFSDTIFKGWMGLNVLLLSAVAYVNVKDKKTEAFDINLTPEDVGEELKNPYRTMDL